MVTSFLFCLCDTNGVPNCESICCYIADDEESPNIDANKLSGVRLKLEERRRHIEQEKRKMELDYSRKQQKVGKAAFLQAINKVNDS